MKTFREFISEAGATPFTNMSEEWKQSIAEGAADTDTPLDRAKMGISKYDTRTDRQIRMSEFGMKRQMDAANRASGLVKGV